MDPGAFLNSSFMEESFNRIGVIMHRVFLLFILLGMLLISSSCYTTFRQPKLGDNSSQIESNREPAGHRSAIVLPDAALQNDSWQFYYLTPWWYDDLDMITDPTIPLQDRTAPRLPLAPGGYDAPVAMPMNITPPALSKPLPENSDQNVSAPEESRSDPKRSFGRRQDTTTKDTKEENSNKRKSRRD